MGQHYYPLNPHLCFKVALALQFVESFLCTTCFNLWGPFHYRTSFAYFNDEPPQKCSRSSWANKLDAPPLVLLEIFLTWVAHFCTSIAWQSLLLAPYLSFGFLLPKIVLIGVSLSYTFWLPTPIIILIAILSAFNLACAPSLHECSMFKERRTNSHASGWHSGVELW